MIKKICLMGMYTKEDGRRFGLIATTHPDKVGDILSKESLEQMASLINNTDASGGQQGAYRSVSLYHDWVKQNEPALDEAGFLIPGSAKVIPLDDSHYGCEVEYEINKHYSGDLTPEEIDYRIQKGSIAGFSIEYDTDPSQIKTVTHGGKQFRFIKSLKEFAGVGFARARMIANPHAVIYKEVEEQTMSQEIQEPAAPIVPESAPAAEPENLSAKEVAISERERAIEQKEQELKLKEQEIKASTELKVKELLGSEEFRNAVASEVQVKSKIVKTNKEENSMTEQTLSVKEMNAALAKNDVLSFKEAASNFLSENNELFTKQMESHGIPLRTTLKVKCEGTKLKIVGQLQVKDTLDTGTNTSSYTQNIVEFADVYLPGIVDTFNNQTNLFGALRKVPLLEGGNKYGWRITTERESDLSVDPDLPTVVKTPVGKLKLQTDIKEYRKGVSVSDYTLHHSRASMGDLFMIEVEKRMRDVMRDINRDLFTEQVDSTTKILGLEAVADSAGNTTLYGLTRSTANRLAPDTATDTYQAVGGATTSALIRGAMRKVEVEGALRQNLRIIVNPLIRDVIFELEDGNLRYFGPAADFGFTGTPRYDGVPMIVDSQCQTDALFVIDDESYFIVISKPPQLVGLAKVGAAEEAYISVYLAAVYEQPRRIHMLDTLS